jgi:hypothetical protein
LLIKPSRAQTLNELNNESPRFGGCWWGVGGPCYRWPWDAPGRGQTPPHGRARGERRPKHGPETSRRRPAGVPEAAVSTGAGNAFDPTPAIGRFQSATGCRGPRLGLTSESARAVGLPWLQIRNREPCQLEMCPDPLVPLTRGRARDGR